MEQHLHVHVYRSATTELHGCCPSAASIVLLFGLVLLAVPSAFFIYCCRVEAGTAVPAARSCPSRPS